MLKLVHSQEISDFQEDLYLPRLFEPQCPSSCSDFREVGLIFCSDGVRALSACLLSYISQNTDAFDLIGLRKLSRELAQNAMISGAKNTRFSLQYLKSISMSSTIPVEKYINDKNEIRWKKYVARAYIQILVIRNKFNQYNDNKINPSRDDLVFEKDTLKLHFLLLRAVFSVAHDVSI